MKDFKKVEIVGNLTRDPELIAFTNGFKARGTVVSHEYKKIGETTECFSTFIPYMARNKTAEKLCLMAKKGDRIFIYGTLGSNFYEEDGKKRSSLEVVVEDFFILRSLGERAEKENAQNEAGQ